MKWITLLRSNRAIRKADSDINIQKILKENIISDKLTNKENFIGRQNRVVARESEMKRSIAPSFLGQSNTNSRGILPFIEGKAGRGNEFTNKGNQSHAVQGLDKANDSEMESSGSIVGDGGLADAFQAVVDASTKSPSLDKEIIGGYSEVEPTSVSVVENFFGGIGDAAKSTAEGLWNLATHPIDTAQNLGNAIAHPIDTAEAIYDSVSDSFKENVIDGDADTRARFAGRAIGEIGLGVAGTKGLDKAVKAIKAGENAAEATAILAKGPRNAKFNRSMSERRKALLRDADDPKSGLTQEARDFIEENKGNKIPEESGKAVVSEADRLKLNGWKEPPSDDLYLANKDVYDNPKYFNQETGDTIWPGQNGDTNTNGFVNGESTPDTLVKGQIIDRYGENASGRFFSEGGTPFEDRALPPFMQDATLDRYEVLKPFDVNSGPIAPWFDQPGLGKQYFTPGQILNKDGDLVPINLGNLKENGYIKKL